MDTCVYGGGGKVELSFINEIYSSTQELLAKNVLKAKGECVAPSLLAVREALKRYILPQ